MTGKNSLSALCLSQKFFFENFVEFSCKAVLKFTVRTIIGLQIYFHWRFWVGMGITAVFSRCTDSLIASSSCSSASHVTAKVLTFIYVSFPSASNNIVSRYICQILNSQTVQKIIYEKYMWFFTHHHLLFLWRFHHTSSLITLLIWLHIFLVGMLDRRFHE